MALIYWEHIGKNRPPRFQNSVTYRRMEFLPIRAVYIVARKGKDLDLPAQTGMLVRMDNTITVPGTSATSPSLTSSR